MKLPLHVFFVSVGTPQSKDRLALDWEKLRTYSSAGLAAKKKKCPKNLRNATEKACIPWRYVFY
jgi:hypothetical protein